MILQVRIDLSEDQLIRLAFKARGYLRVNPRVPWKESERREAARVAIQQMVSSQLDADAKSY